MEKSVEKEGLISKALFKKVEDLRLKAKVAYNYVKPYIPDDKKGQVGAMAFTLRSMYDAITFTKQKGCGGYWRSCVGYLRYGNLFLKLLRKYCRGVVV